MFDRGIIGLLNRLVYGGLFCSVFTLGAEALFHFKGDRLMIAMLLSCLIGWFVSGMELGLLFQRKPSILCICFLLLQAFMGVIFMAMTIGHSPTFSAALKQYYKGALIAMGLVLCYFGITYLLDYLYKRHIIKEAERDVRLQMYLDREEAKRKQTRP